MSDNNKKYNIAVIPGDGIGPEVMDAGLHVLTRIAEKFGCEAGDVVFALDTGRFVVSLNESGDEDGTPLGDRLVGAEAPEEDIDGLMLRDSIKNLPEREKKIIILRYFRDKTQSEVAAELGVSQVQVSRLESKILRKIREKME